MQRWLADWRIRAAFTLLAVAGFANLTLAQTPAPQTVLRIFTGGAQRIEVTRSIAEGYMMANPTIRIEVEPGGATPEQQQQYLGAALAAKDQALDLILIDVIRPAQWVTAQWLEPLDAYLGAEKEAVMARYLPAYRAVSQVNGRVVALPLFADAQFLYFRKDLLEKHGVAPPGTWDEVKAGAQKIMAGENNPALRGFETTGASVESAVCTYLVPLWGAGEEMLKAGKLNLAGEAAKKPFALWMEMKEARVAPPNMAEIATDRIRQDFQAGNLIFGMSWGYMWNRSQNDADSVVKDKIGVLPPPGFLADRPASCLGGWQVAVSGFSKNKAEAVKFARYLSSPEIAKQQAILAGHLPVFAAVYEDAEVKNVNPWFAQALPALLAAKSRPVSPRYGEVSEIMRTNINAVLAGTKSADAALADMNARLAVIFR